MSELYAVRWADAHGSDGTLQAHEVDHKPYVYTTVGFLVRSDSVGVSVAFELGEDGRYRDITFVPRAIVLKDWSLGKLREGGVRGKVERSRKPQADVSGGVVRVVPPGAAIREEPPDDIS